MQRANPTRRAITSLIFLVAYPMWYKMSLMKTLVTLILLLLVLSNSATAAAAEFFRWTDEKGNVNFTDNLHNIPEKFRSKMDTYRTPEVKAQPVPPPKTKTSIPFEKQGSVVIVDATLNRKTTAKLVVDTGASYTMISSATAKDLSIDAGQSQRTAPFQTANGVIQAPIVSLESITVGGIEVKNLTAAVHDIQVDPRVSGLLGLNFLSNFRMDIDTQTGVLHLEKNSQPCRYPAFPDSRLAKIQRSAFLNG